MDVPLEMMVRLQNYRRMGLDPIAFLLGPFEWIAFQQYVLGLTTVAPDLAESPDPVTFYGKPVRCVDVPGINLEFESKVAMRVGHICDIRFREGAPDAK